MTDDARLHSPAAARYAGIKEAKIIVITMMISGGLAGMMALNPIMGEQFRMQLDFVQGAGFGMDEAAEQAVWLSRFRPATRAGRPVASQAILPVRFTLR